MEIHAGPFVKWVGGKTNLLPALLKRMPEKFNRYHEPFIGGGALFFQTAPDASFISDVNYDLMLSYQIVKMDPHELVLRINRHFENHSKKYYYTIRNLHKVKNPLARVARFIYLNRACFNGLYRENKKGEFNVPIGTRNKMPDDYEKNLMFCSRVLQTTNISIRHFSQMSSPTKEDLVYFDPPYDATFNQYSARSFTKEDQTELRDLCVELDRKKVYFMVSNSDTDFIRQLYSRFKIEKISIFDSISSKTNDRKNRNEVIITNY
jgi:DNA adenine methylase